MWFAFQVLLVGCAIGCPVIIWHKLGDTEYVERLGPTLQRIFGIKLFTGENGRTYMEPPPPLKRLQISLLWGLGWTAVLGAAAYWPFVWGWL